MNWALQRNCSARCKLDRRLMSEDEIATEDYCLFRAGVTLDLNFLAC